MFTPFTELTVQSLKRIFNEIQKPILMNRIINVSLTTTETKINHLLGRIPLGYVVIKKNVASDVFGEFDNKTLNLTATVDVTVSLLVF